MEVELVLEGLPENLLKLVSVEGSPDTLPNLSKFLKLGALLQATVLESLPEKNKAIIKISNKRIIVETRQALTPGHSFSAQVHKSSPGSPLQIKIIASPPDLRPSNFEDKTQISGKSLPNNVTGRVFDKTSTPEPNDRSIVPQANNMISQEMSAREIDSMNLLPGQTIKATVIDISGKNNAVVKFKNRLITAYFPALSPKPGANASLVVTAHGDNFRLVAQQDGTPKAIDVFKIKALLPFKESFGEMIQKLDVLINSSEVIKNLSTETGLVERFVKTLNLFKIQSLGKRLPVQDSTQLKEQIDLSGINYEPKVKKIFQGKEPYKVPHDLKVDLKGQLMRLLEVVEVRVEEKDTSPNQRRQFMEAIKIFRSAVGNIELQQLTNQVSRQESQPIVLQIPDPFMIGKTVNLYVRHVDNEGKGKSNKDNDSVLLVFLLELSALGNLRVDAKMNKESISVRIDVENQDIAQFIDGNLKEFCARLGELGFEVNASCSVVRKIEDNLSNQLNQLLIDDSKRLVDLTT
ncbi:MAG TPA: flagellar hook-length control protein FliK [Nitrospina sp.]|nr:flagellar hook-length control protein FliK [Nitrospina sp.]